MSTITEISFFNKYGVFLTSKNDFSMNSINIKYRFESEGLAVCIRLGFEYKNLHSCRSLYRSTI